MTGDEVLSQLLDLLSQLRGASLAVRQLVALLLHDLSRRFAGEVFMPIHTTRDAFHL